MTKANNQFIDQKFLDKRRIAAEKNGYPKAKWILFCEIMLNEGHQIKLYEARETVSKYVTVIRNGMQFKVRFSNHRPIKQRELDGDCDFFVGVTHLGCTTTQDACDAVRSHFNQLPPLLALMAQEQMALFNNQ